MPDPLLTIIICTRNRGARLTMTLDALSKIKSEHAWDVLMVDNASTDHSAEIIQSYTGLGERLHYTKAVRIGLGAARDHAWRLAKGHILAFTDDDCYPEPDFVDALVDVFARHPDVALVGGRILLYDPEDIPTTIDLRNMAEECLPYSYVETGSYNGANMAVRRSALAQIGGFDPGLGAGTKFPCEDIDIAAALSWAGFKTRFDPSPLVYHHHGRRAADAAGLAKSYDAGRGAYYTKYLLRKDSRNAYLKGWTQRIRSHPFSTEIIRFSRELRSGAAYAVSVGRRDFVLIGAPVAALVLATLTIVVAVRITTRKLFELISLRSN